ncbi:hypothetical protein BGW41_001974 [Actinomortierella wolfii]|nr:hypothetical protein BGW41_001974 [Actinomortierella wolfii]
MFPTEILQQVVFHLQDNRQALHSCMLVSRAWSKAAVEYLYKAEHMMVDVEGATSALPPSNPVFDPPRLAESEVQQGSGRSLSSDVTTGQLRSTTSRARLSVPNSSNPSSTHYLAAFSAGSPVPATDAGAFQGTPSSPSAPEALTQHLLKRTLTASLLMDDSCSYDYISYMNKISCLWFESLIHDWKLFCRVWRGSSSRTHHHLLPITDAEVSKARKRHCFNRLIRKVTKRCTSINEFVSSTLVTPETMSFVFRKFRHITWIDLKESPELNDAVFHAIADNVRYLSYIRLPGACMTNVTSGAVARMLLAQDKNTLCQFKIIYGSNIFEDNSILRAIGEHHGQSMRRLTLAMCDLEQAGLAEYGPLCTRLTSLNLEYSTGVTNEAVIPILDACRTLTKLDLTETGCTQATLQALSTASDSTTPQQRRMSHLRRLIINNIDAPFTTAVFLPLAESCPQLEELYMNSVLADTYADFEQFIAKMPKIRDLDIGNIFPEFTDEHLKSLVDRLPELRWLSIPNTQITNESLLYLAKHAKQLTELCVLGCDQLTGEGILSFLDALQNKRGFHRLDITYCRLEEVVVESIKEKVQEMAAWHQTEDLIEIEGEDQFTDSLLEEEEEDEGEDDGDDNDGGEDGDDEAEGDDEEVEALVTGAAIIELEDNEDDGNNTEQVDNEGDGTEIEHGPAGDESDDGVVDEEEEEEQEELSDWSDTYSEDEQVQQLPGMIARLKAQLGMTD